MKRGKRLSATLPMPYGILNPQKAYAAAKKVLSRKGISSYRRRRMSLNAMGQTPLEAMLNIPSPYQEPWPGAKKVPHTCYEWY